MLCHSSKESIAFDKTIESNMAFSSTLDHADVVKVDDSKMMNDDKLLTRIDIDITIDNGKHVMRKVAETNRGFEDEIIISDNCTNRQTVNVEQSEEKKTNDAKHEDGSEGKHPYYISEESETFQYTETEIVFQKKISTSSSGYADSGISISSPATEEHNEYKLVEYSEDKLVATTDELQVPSTRFSVDESRRLGDIFRIFKSRSRHRRSCSLPDILDIESYKHTDPNDKNASEGDIEIRKANESGYSDMHVKAVSNAQLSRPICGQFHKEDPCYICLKDNEIYCSVCVQLHNFHCREKVKYIPEIAPEIRTSLCNNTMRELRCMRDRLNRVRKENTENFKNLNAMRKTYMQSVMKYKNSIIQMIDRIEKEALLEMDIVFNENSKKIEDNTMDLENEMSKIDMYLDRFQNNANTCGNGVIFDIQEAIQETKSYESKVHEYHRNTCTIEMSFEPLDELKRLLTHVDGLWKFNKTETVMCKLPSPCACDRPYMYRTPVKEKEFSARLSGWSFDREKCYITGCKFMPNGYLLLSDNNNRKVKMFDKKYKCISALSLHSMPWEIALIDSDMAVVSIPDKKQLQFIGTHHKLSLKHSLVLKKNCWGLSYNGSNLFVTCWSRDASEVVIIDLQGNPQRRIETVLGVRFHTPWFVATRDDVIYVSDWGTYTVPCVTISGTAVNNYRNRNLVGPLGMTFDPEGNVYVCGRDSNNVHQLSPDGSIQQIILSEKDGIHQPLNISHCSTDDRLVVTSWMSDKVQIYKLH